MLESEEIDEEDRKRFKLLKSGEGSKILVIRSLSLLMRLLENYYHKQMILLIDEYDVPIAKASSKGYYQQMLEIIRGMMSTALKDNTSLKFAVITGCLQIAKESIFTGTNNFVTDTIANTGFNEYFGFTQQEVNKILEDTGTVQYAKQMKEWYDGYHMGEIDVYCPWDVMNYCGNFREIPKRSQSVIGKIPVTTQLSALSSILQAIALRTKWKHCFLVDIFFRILMRT